jgi:hypothetical protein
LTEAIADPRFGKRKLTFMAIGGQNVTNISLISIVPNPPFP